MEITFDLNEDDVRALALHQSKTSTLPARKFKTVISVIWLVSVMISGSYIISGDVSMAWYGFTAGVAALATFIVWHVLPGQIANATVGEYRRSGQKRLGPHRMRADAEGLWQTSALAEAKFFWTSIVAIIETEKHFFIYVTSTDALILPTHDLDPEFMARVAEYRHAALSPEPVIGVANGD